MSSSRSANPTRFVVRIREHLGSFGASFRSVPKVSRLLSQADRLGYRLMIVVSLTGALLPLGQAWAAKSIIDRVLLAIHDQASTEDGLRLVSPYLLLEFALIFLGMALSQGKMLLEEVMDQRLKHSINTRIIEKALSLEMKYFENARFYDKMQNARRQSAGSAVSLVSHGFSLLQNLVSLASFLVVLIAFNPWIAAFLVFAAIPAFAIQSRYSHLSFRLQTRRAPESRSLNYLEQVLTLDSTVKEVKLFQLGKPLLERYRALFRKIFREDYELARHRSIRSLLWGALATLTYYGAFAWIIVLAIRKSITLGDMTLYLTLFQQTQVSSQSLLASVGRLYENGLFLENLFDFLELRGEVRQAERKARPKEDLSRGVEFDRVWFRYPESQGEGEWILRDFSMTIGPRERLAIMGENGAGKSTIVKLLTRLYEPTQGVIRLHGVELSEYSPEELQSRIGALFQDFVRFQLTLAENIGLGSVEHLQQRSRIEAAAAKSGAGEIAEALPKKLDTQLGHWFDEGHELSGGQWQKVALGRAFMREGDLLVLDEPTASLDPLAEHELVERFRQLSQDRMALIISHRFSTLRMADRILVLGDGRVEETGSHSQLMERNQAYARLYRMKDQVEAPV